MDIFSADTRAKLNQIFGFSSVATIAETYVVARKALAVEGCFVECGVAGGGGSAPMALALVEAGDRRTLHLFDSFEGLPHCGPKDGGQMGHHATNYLMDPLLPESERLKTTNISVGTLAQVQENMKKWQVDAANISYHKGWFQHTLPGLKLAPIAFLRLDGDLYESTMCCLDNLYDQVAPGGYVWLDEWGMPEGIGGKQAIKDFFHKRGVQFPTFEGVTDTGAGYWKV
jgi:O-methyltransferase